MNDALRTYLKWFAYAYILRFPLLTAAAMLGLVVGAKWFAHSLLGNLFDINWPSGIFLLSFTAFSASWTVMTTLHLVLLHGRARFHLNTFCNPYEPGEDVKWWHLSLSGLLGLTLVVYAITYTNGHNPPDPAHQRDGVSLPLMIFMALLGLLLSLCFLYVATLVQNRLTNYGTACAPAPQHVQGAAAGAPERVRAAPNMLLPANLFGMKYLDSVSRKSAPLTFPKLIRGLPENLLKEDIWRGYFKYKKEAGLPVCILHGHILAAAFFFLTLGFYVVAGIVKFFRLGYDPYLPTLGYVLLLLILLCWGLSGAAFFLDRFRIPVMLPLLILFTITSASPLSDHFYPVVARTQERRPVPCERGAQPASATTGVPALGGPIIVVAANGGGIQAGAWAAVVLTELERRFGNDFGTHLRVVSSVSGGSVGAMYFVNEYTAAGSPPSSDELDGIVERVEGSSLDEIAWGLAYPDLMRLLTSYGSSWDRGRALQYAWLRRDLGGKWKNRGGIEEGLSKWQAEVAAGHRPGSIFNTTVSDTGQRLPLSTIDLPPCSEGKQTQDKLFDGLVGNDLSVATAARLSASFPYVSPAARADLGIGETLTGQPHIVDGGYYDNYGISSLVEWLDYEMSKPENTISRVLLVEIRGSRTGGDYVFEKRRGWLYQTFAPLGTLLHVRDTGQFSHNRVELQLLIDKWKGGSGVRRIPITDVVFEYDGSDPPLSWHLNQVEKQDLKSSWARVADNPDPKVQKSTTETGKGGLTIVGDFLSQPR